MRPRIVCLCGSTRFKDAFMAATLNESLEGRIVLSVACFTHADGIELTTDQKVELDILHFHKIDVADDVFVVNPDGYIGESTRNEIEYAVENRKPVRFLHEPTFVAQCRLGTASLSDIDTHVARWHESDGGLSLHEYLGMTSQEYKTWVENPDAINDIVRNER